MHLEWQLISYLYKCRKCLGSTRKGMASLDIPGKHLMSDNPLKPYLAAFLLIQKTRLKANKYFYIKKTAKIYFYIKDPVQL